MSREENTHKRSKLPQSLKKGISNPQHYIPKQYITPPVVSKWIFGPVLKQNGILIIIFHS